MAGPSNRAVILARAAALLGAAGLSTAQVRVLVQNDQGDRIVISGGAEPALVEDLEACPSGCRPYSELEREIVAALAGRSWTNTADLADLLHRTPGSDFRAILRNLADAGVLQSSQAGFSLPANPASKLDTGGQKRA